MNPINPITTNAEAESAIDELSGLIEKMSDLLAQETDLVRAGRLRSACEIEPAKKELAARIYTAGEQLKANSAFLMRAVPARCAALKGVQEAFRAVVQRNMIVLATAHAVSEGIVRRLSGDLAKKASPHVYGSTGRTVAPNPKHGRPLAVSRTL
jgi:hypothetical protein